MKEEQEWLSLNIPAGPKEEEGYITIEGQTNICDKIKNLLSKAEERVYLSCSASCLVSFKDDLEEILKKGKKLVLITDQKFVLEGATVYVTEAKGSQIGLITDSRYVISGEYGETGMNTCLYSGKKNFVMLFKTALANEIKLIKIQKGEKEDEKNSICNKRAD